MIKKVVVERERERNSLPPESPFFFSSSFFLFVSLQTRSFSLTLSIKMAADKDKMEVDGSPPPAAAQAGPATTQVRGKKEELQQQSVVDDVDVDGRDGRRRFQCASERVEQREALSVSLLLAGACDPPALDVREQRGVLNKRSHIQIKIPNRPTRAPARASG